MHDFATLARAVYGDIGNSGLPLGWVALDVFRDRGIGLQAALFVNPELCAAVLAVRGSDELANYLDDVRLALGTPPQLEAVVAHILTQIAQEHATGELRTRVALLMDRLACELDVRLELFLTGHSLGASVASMAFAQYFVNNYPNERWAPPVLFESPGMPQAFHETVEVHAAMRGIGPQYGTMRRDVVEYLGAPNPINMLHKHFGLRRCRVRIPHGMVVDHVHVLRCTWGSASRALLFVGLGVGVRAAVLAAEAAEAAEVAVAAHAGVAAGYALSRSMGNILEIKDYCPWILKQHSIVALCAAFPVGANIPHDSVNMREWPTHSVLWAALRSLARYHIPFHPGNHGLHTLSDPDAVVEQRIQAMDGYVVL